MSKHNRQTAGNPLLGEEKAMAETAEKPKVEALVLVPNKGKTRGPNPKEITYNQLSRVPLNINEFNTVTGTASGVQNNTTGVITSTESGPGAASNTATVSVATPAPPTIAKSFGIRQRCLAQGCADSVPCGCPWHGETL